MGADPGARLMEPRICADAHGSIVVVKAPLARVVGERSFFFIASRSEHTPAVSSRRSVGAADASVGIAVPTAISRPPPVGRNPERHPCHPEERAARRGICLPVRTGRTSLPVRERRSLAEFTLRRSRRARDDTGSAPDDTAALRMTTPHEQSSPHRELWREELSLPGTIRVHPCRSVVPLTQHQDPRPSARSAAALPPATIPRHDPQRPMVAAARRRAPA